MKLQTLYEYAKAQGATGVKMLNNGNGNFIVMSKLPKGEPTRFTLEDETFKGIRIPVSKNTTRSGERDLSKFNVILSDGRALSDGTPGKIGQPIASINTVEELAQADF